MSATPLPQIGVKPAERGDAARNRALLLDAAALLVTELGVDAVTMDAVACRAGVGKGTVFRRFGSRSGLMQALLDHTEREFQQAFMFGPAPLGPDAPPIDRLIAFGRVRIAMMEVQGDLLRAAESAPEFRFGSPARALNITHVISLLRDAGINGDVELLASALLSPLEATLVLYQVRDLGMSPARLADGWENLARRVTRC